MTEHYMEATFSVHDVGHGNSVEVGYDGDGLDMMEIRSLDDKGVIERSLVVDADAVPLLVEAMQRWLTFRAAMPEAKKP